MLGATGLLLGALAAAAVPGHAGNEPYLAVRMGLKCSACHTNRTGGGMRNDFGAVFAGTRLPASSDGFRLQNRALNDFVRLGMDVRLTGTAVLEDASPQTAFNLNRANVYVEARLIDDKVTVYWDETLAPGGAQSRELFAMIDALPLNGYAKVGSFFLPSGWRLLDDQEFVREQTGFTMLAPDQGVEVGIEPGRFGVFVSLTNGSVGAAENNSGKQVTGTAQWVATNFRFGGSASRNTAGGRHRDVLGGFAGVGGGPVSLLGEVDYVLDDASGTDQLVAYGEGNLLVTNGVNAKVSYGFHDRNTDRPEDERIRARFGLEVFPIPYLQVSGFFTLRDDIPAALLEALPQQEELTLELHLLF